MSLKYYWVIVRSLSWNIIQYGVGLKKRGGGAPMYGKPQRKTSCTIEAEINSYGYRQRKTWNPNAIDIIRQKEGCFPMYLRGNMALTYYFTLSVPRMGQRHQVEPSNPTAHPRNLLLPLYVSQWKRTEHAPGWLPKD